MSELPAGHGDRDPNSERLEREQLRSAVILQTAEASTRECARRRATPESNLPGLPPSSRVSSALPIPPPPGTRVGVVARTY
eukprot:353304-Chlamydomonas_euryale.AAC.1